MHCAHLADKHDLIRPIRRLAGRRRGRDAAYAKQGCNTRQQVPGDRRARRRSRVSVDIFGEVSRKTIAH